MPMRCRVPGPDSWAADPANVRTTDHRVVAADRVAPSAVRDKAIPDPGVRRLTQAAKGASAFTRGRHRPAGPALKTPFRPNDRMARLSVLSRCRLGIAGRGLKRDVKAIAAVTPAPRPRSWHRQAGLEQGVSRECLLDSASGAASKRLGDCSYRGIAATSQYLSATADVVCGRQLPVPRMSWRSVARDRVGGHALKPTTAGTRVLGVEQSARCCRCGARLPGCDKAVDDAGRLQRESRTCFSKRLSRAVVLAIR